MYKKRRMKTRVHASHREHYVSNVLLSIFVQFRLFSSTVASSFVRPPAQFHIESSASQRSLTLGRCQKCPSQSFSSRAIKWIARSLQNALAIEKLTLRTQGSSLSPGCSLESLTST